MRQDFLTFETEMNEQYAGIIDALTKSPHNKVFNMMTLKNIWPDCKVKYIFISSELSYRGGNVLFNNIIYRQNVLFHFAIREYLFGENEHWKKDKLVIRPYHITDVSKIAVNVNKANVKFIQNLVTNRTEDIGMTIYDIFEKEKSLVSDKDCSFVFIKPAARNMLRGKFLNCKLIYHYSYLRNNTNKKLNYLNTEVYNDFRNSFQNFDISKYRNKLLVLYGVQVENIPNINFDPNNNQQMRLLFYYREIFSAIRQYDIAGIR